MTAQTPTARPLRVAALVKQIPAFENMEMGPDGRLHREGVPLEMSAFCRRAVAQGVLLATQTGGSCTVFTLGPPSAEDVLREALAYGADDAVLVTDPAFAGSDTLATALALAAALGRRGPFDLVLVGRNSVDAETGQVGPELAQLLDLPFATGVKQLELDAAAHTVRVGCEQDDAWLEATVALPAVLSTAERLIDPCKIKDPELLAAVDAARITTFTAADLGPGPWGQAASPTRVGEVRVESVTRRRRRLDGSVSDQVEVVVAAMAERGLLDPDAPAHVHRERSTGAGTSRARARGRTRRRAGRAGPPAPAARAARRGRRVGRQPGRTGRRHRRVAHLARSHRCRRRHGARHLGRGAVVVIEPTSPAGNGSAHHGLVEEDIATAVAAWSRAVQPEIILAPSTAWGREVAARVAADLGAGLTGDAIGLELDGRGRLVAWKPAFGGAMVAAIEATSPIQLVTVRPGVLAMHAPRSGAEIPVTTTTVEPRGRVVVTAHRRDDDLDVLASATRVVSVGKGVDPADYPHIDALVDALGAELAATRKVTDAGWLPHSRQVGITGQNLAPDARGGGRRQRQVQPHGRTAARRPDRGRQPRPRRAGLRLRRLRDRGRLARRRPRARAPRPRRIGAAHHGRAGVDPLITA